MEPTPFSCTRTRKSSSPRSTGRCVPGARPAEVAPGMVKRSPPRLLLSLAWICALLRVLSDGGGWNGDGAAGCPAVVVVDVVGGVVIVGAGGGGDGAVVPAGAGGAVRRAGRGFGASTVTCGIGSAGAVPGSACGVSGAGGDGAGVSGAGVGVSGGVVVAGGVSGGVGGVCGDATPAKESSTSAELLSRSKRLLWMDITRPTSSTGTTRQSRRSTHDGESSAAWGIGRALAGARAARDHNRCQAMGGARALKSAACDAVRSNSAAASSRNRPKTAGSGNDGTSAGTNAPARWMSVQIGQ